MWKHLYQALWGLWSCSRHDPRPQGTCHLGDERSRVRSSWTKAHSRKALLVLGSDERLSVAGWKCVWMRMKVEIWVRPDGGELWMPQLCTWRIWIASCPCDLRGWVRKVLLHGPGQVLCPSRLGGQVFRRVPILVALKIIFSPDMTLKADPFSSKWVGFYIRMQTWWVGKNTREPFDALDPWWRRRGGSNLRGEWMVMGYNFSPPAQGLAHSVGIEGAWTEYSQ